MPVRELPSIQGHPGLRRLAPTAGIRKPACLGSVAFGRFVLTPSTRQLSCDGVALQIGGRAFDLLLVLISAPGQILSKAELLQKVWPDVTVDESNLRFQMAELRDVLGSDRDVIKTVTGRGYVFVGSPSRDHATFEAALSIPVAKPNEFERPNHRTTSSLHPPSGTIPVAPRVVIVDDDVGICEALQGLLRSAGMRVEHYTSVQLFLDSAELDPPNCLILDVCLPDRNGIDFLEELARIGVEVPIIFISGHADVPMSVRAMKAGAAEFLIKPVRQEAILDAVRAAVR